MIDEKKLAKYFYLLRSYALHLDANGMRNSANQIYEVADYLKSLKEQPKTDWIPCEVELPPKPRFSEDSYLVKTKCVTTPYTAYWNGEKWTNVLDDDIEDVIAWCTIPPYPQPYKKEVAENE